MTFLKAKSEFENNGWEINFLTSVFGLPTSDLL